MGGALVAAVLLLPAALPGRAAAQDPAALRHPMRVAYDVRVHMPDGVYLSVDVYRPRDDDRHPAVFVLTPYDNTWPLLNVGATDVMEEAWTFVRRGYAYVTADVRGRFDSAGEFEPFRNDRRDGAALLSWIAAQPWSDGRVATMGPSYLGYVQWLMAGESHAAHAAIVSYVAPADDFLDGSRYNGVPKLDLMYTWMMGMDGRVRQPMQGWDLGVAMRNLPLTSLDGAAGRDVPYWRDRMQHDRLDDYWAPLQTSGTHHRLDVPTFHVTGWYEGQLRGAIKHYMETIATTRDTAAHVLLIGPWLHSVNAHRVVGERDGGPEALIDLDGMRDAWLDHVLLGAPSPDLPAVGYFLPVANEWRAAAGWPLPGTRFTPFYLDSGGHANTASGDGSLSAERPGLGPPDGYRYDPAHPVPSVTSRTAGARGGLATGPVDHREAKDRADVLVYTSAPLAQDLEVTGPVEAVIYIATDVPDTDVAVKLFDVAPDGRALNLSEGIARAKYRESYVSPAPLEPGRVTAIRVELFPTSNLFRAGHRIRVQVTGSDFPNFGRNLNRMDSDTGVDHRPADVRVYHSSEHPSRILLPVVPPGVAKPWRPPARP